MEIDGLDAGSALEVGEPAAREPDDEDLRICVEGMVVGLPRELGSHVSLEIALDIVGVNSHVEVA